MLVLTNLEFPLLVIAKSETFPLSASTAPLKNVIRPSPPESTTPACFSMGSISGVLRSASSMLSATASQNSMTSSISSLISISIALTVRIVPYFGFITAL